MEVRKHLHFLRVLALSTKLVEHWLLYHSLILYIFHVSLATGQLSTTLQ